MQIVTLASFVFFTGLVGVLTWWLTRHDRHDTNDGYFLGGRSLTGGYIAGSLLLTNLSTEQLVGLNGAAFKDGLCVMAWEVIAGASLVIMALFFLPHYLKSGIATIPQFLEERFGATTRAITSIIFIIAYAGILLPMVLYTGAVGLRDILNVSEITGIRNDTANLWIMIWLIGIIGSIYAIFGGLRTVAVSDTINGFGLLVGGLMIAWMALKLVSPEAPLEAFSVLKEAHPEKFNSLGGPNQSVPFSTLFTGVLLLNLFYWTTNQQIIQRTFGAKNLGEGQRGVLIAGLFKILAPLILVVPGIVAFHAFGQVTLDGQRVPVVDVTTEKIAVSGTLDGVPTVIHGLDAEKLLGSSDPAAVAIPSGQELNYKGQRFIPEKVLGPRVLITRAEGQGFRYTSQKELERLGTSIERFASPRLTDKAYGVLVRQVLPTHMRGFFAAAILGAILSSFNSALNSTATLFSLGVYRQMLHPDATDERVIHSGKVFGWIIAIAAMLVAPLLANTPQGIFGYLQKMNGLYFIPIFSVVLIGMLTKRVPGFAANLGLVVGFLVISLGYFVPALATHVNAIHEFHFLGIVFAGLLALMYGVGQAFPMAVPYEQKDSRLVDMTPWKPAWPMGIGLILVVVSLYLYFADLSVLRG